MLIVFSHILAFSVLFVGSIFDLDRAEVPDWLSLIGIIGGIALHFLYSYRMGYMNLEILQSVTLVDVFAGFPFPIYSFIAEFGLFQFAELVGTPVLYSLGIGIIFSVYGWSLYHFGMWGGADAFAMSVLGFAAPFSIQGIGFMHAVDLFINVMIAGFAYTLFVAFYKAFTTERVYTKFKDRLIDQEKRISLEIILAAAFSTFLVFYSSLNPLMYFGFLLTLILVYRVLQVVEEEAFSEIVPVEDLEGGEVAAPGQGLGNKVVGITEEDIQSLDRDELEIKSGVKFIPVFPAALVMTSLSIGGLQILSMIV